MAGDRLDLTSDSGAELPRGGDSQRRRYLGVRFSCCEVYARIYVNRQQTAYEGRCPRCLRQLTIKIGPGGSDTRIFTAY